VAVLYTYDIIQTAVTLLLLFYICGIIQTAVTVLLLFYIYMALFRK